MGGREREGRNCVFCFSFVFVLGGNVDEGPLHWSGFFPSLLFVSFLISLKHQHILVFSLCVRICLQLLIVVVVVLVS